MNDKVIIKEGKDGMGNIYLMDVPVVYAVVQEPKNKYTPEGVKPGSLGKEYSLITFVGENERVMLEDEMMLNKTFFKVGVDKNKKRQIKYKLTSQVKDAEEGWESPYDPYEDLYGFSLTLPENKKNGEPNVLNVIDAEGSQIEELVGNGSVCNIKLFYYTNKDDLKNVALDTVQVTELVHYEGGESSGVDDVLGVTIQQKQAPKSSNTSQSDDIDNGFDDFGDDIPF